MDMNHGDHGGHGGHGGMPPGGHEGHDMPMPMRCSMNMLWNTQIEDTCILFESWHISGATSFVLSCAALVAFGVFFEWLRTVQTNADQRIALSLSAKDKGKTRGASVSGRTTPEIETSEEDGLLTGQRGLKPGVLVPASARVLRASLYALMVFLSYMLMLVAMTYNAYLIFSVVFGAAIGHYIFSARMDVDAVLSGVSGGKGMACH